MMKTIEKTTTASVKVEMKPALKKQVSYQEKALTENSLLTVLLSRASEVQKKSSKNAYNANAQKFVADYSRYSNLIADRNVELKEEKLYLSKLLENECNDEERIEAARYCDLLNQSIFALSGERRALITSAIALGENGLERFIGKIQKIVNRHRFKASRKDMVEEDDLDVFLAEFDALEEPPVTKQPVVISGDYFKGVIEALKGDNAKISSSSHSLFSQSRPAEETGFVGQAMALIRKVGL